MPMPSRSKSLGGFGRSDCASLSTSNINADDHASNCTSHLANLRSISRGKLIKSSSVDRRGSGRHAYDIRNIVSDSGSDVKLAVSHDSVDLLSSRPVIPHPSRRKTIAGNVPFTIEEKEEEQENSLVLPSLTTPLHHAASENQPFSPQVLGGLQYKTSASGRRPFKSRNSIDNADVSQNKPIRKLALEPTREDSREGQADRIRVYVRVRPMSSKEKETGARCCVRAANKREIYLTEIALETDYLRLKRLKGRYFAFDGAFPDGTGQEEIYRASTAQLVEGVLEGRNSSVFCYGATGAGKTFTMLGTVNNPGVMVLALRDLFSKLKQRSKEGEHVVRLSYLEVYNESVRDLLSPGRPLVIREDAKQGIVASGMTQYQAVSADEVMALLQQGNQNRTTEPTRLNETSSRSHAILQVVVEYRARVDACLVTRTGKLSLIDLAGSERAIATDQRTLRSLEGANINRSLLALSSCISALVEGKKHIPFRNSKLTQLLKDSLGGACQTAMIANISPSNLSFGETQNTLYWADRAKEIRTKVSVANEELQVPTSQSEQLQLLLQVQKENQQLRMQVAQLQQKLLELENDALALPPAGQQRNDVRVPSVRPPQKENVEGTDQHGRHEESMMRTPLTHSAVKRKILMRSPLPPPQDSAFGFRFTNRDHSGRKRTFWDITNTSSPSGKQTGRNTRSNTAAEATPSLLLQPGFLRGRPSFN